MKVTHLVWSMWPQNVNGRPNARSCSASRFHSAHEPPAGPVFGTGAESIEPRLESAVIEPMVTMTRSRLADLDLARPAVAQATDAPHGLRTAVAGREVQIGHLDARLEPHALGLEPSDHRADDRVVAAVAGRLDDLHRLEIRKQPQEAQQVAPQLDGAVPRFEAEHAAPHQPEVRFEEVRLEALVDALRVQRVFGLQHQLDQVGAVLVAQGPRRRLDDLAVLDQPGLVVPRRRLPELEGVLRDRLGRIVERRDAVQQIVGQDIGRPEHAAAAHRIALLG